MGLEYHLDKNFSLLRKCHLWFLHWPGVKPSDWYFWSQVLLWIASWIDWMGMSFFFFFLNFNSVVQISLAFRKKCRQFWSELIGGMFLEIIITFHTFVYFKYFLTLNIVQRVKMSYYRLLNVKRVCIILTISVCVYVIK